MGNRGNVTIRANGKDVWFYTHWRGSDLGEIIKAALAKRERWNDAPYLARIIFCELIYGEPEHATTGFGISAEPGDNEYAFWIVDVDKEAVYREPDKRDGFDILPKTEAELIPVPFTDFIK